MLDECASSFLGHAGEGEGVCKGSIPGLPFPRGSSAASECVPDLKPATEDAALRQAGMCLRSVQCPGGGSLPRTASLTGPVPQDPGRQSSQGVHPERQTEVLGMWRSCPLGDSGALAQDRESTEMGPTAGTAEERKGEKRKVVPTGFSKAEGEDMEGGACWIGGRGPVSCDKAEG